MSNVEVPFGDKPSETATLLLAAAEEAGDQSVVQTTSFGTFSVPQEVADAAGLDYESDEDDEKPKKTAAKKTAKKK